MSEVVLLAVARSSWWAIVVFNILSLCLSFPRTTSSPTTSVSFIIDFLLPSKAIAHMIAEDPDFTDVDLESAPPEREDDDYEFVPRVGTDTESINEQDKQDSRNSRDERRTNHSDVGEQVKWDEARAQNTHQASTSQAEDTKPGPETHDADTQWTAPGRPTQEPSHIGRRDSMIDDDNSGALVKYFRNGKPHPSRFHGLDNEATIPDTASFTTSTGLPEAPEPPRPANVPLASGFPGTSSHFPDGPAGESSMPDHTIPSAGGTSGPNFAQCPPHPPPPPPSGPPQGPPPLVFDPDASLADQTHIIQTYLSGLSRQIDDMQKRQFGLASLAVHSTGRAVDELKEVGYDLASFNAMSRGLSAEVKNLGKRVEEMNTRSEEQGIPEMAQKLMSTSVGMSFRMDGLKAKLSGATAKDTLSNSSMLTARNTELEKMGKTIFGSAYQLPASLTEATIKATELGNDFQRTKASIIRLFDDDDDDCAQEGDWEPLSTAGGMPAPPAPPPFMGYGYSSQAPPGPPPMHYGFEQFGTESTSGGFPSFPPGVPPPPPPGSENWPPPPPSKD